MRHDKLVRDKVPERIRAKGETCTTHVADDDEYRAKLKEKFSEELAEYLEKESLEEMADVFEVITAILALQGWKIEDVIKAQQQKRGTHGSFEGRIILEES